MAKLDAYMAALIGAQPDGGFKLDPEGWEDDPVLKGYVGSPYSPCRPANVHSTGLAASIQVKSGMTLLYGFTVLNTKVSAQFVQWFNKQTAPVSGDIPDGVINVNSSSDRTMAWTPLPRVFLVGCWIANSSTAATLTPGSADCYFDVQYL